MGRGARHAFINEKMWKGRKIAERILRYEF